MIALRILSRIFYLRVRDGKHLSRHQILTEIIVAVKDSNLLRLLLAYSASHRARLLQHREPANRIAHWVENVFPSLRRALETNQITNEGLATAIMLASLEIISPNTFEHR